MRKTKLKRFAALVLSMLMALTCMPMGAMAEEAAGTDDGVTVEVILDEPISTDVEPVEDDPSPDATTEDSDVGEAEISPEEPAALMEESMNPEAEPPAAEDETIPEESDIPNTDHVAEGDTESSSDLTEEDQPADKSQDERPPLELALDAFGAVYVPTLRPISVYSSPVLKKDTLVYTSAGAKDLVLATGYTEHDTIIVWFMDADSSVVKGFVAIRDMDEKFIQVDDLENYTDQPTTDAMTAVGMMPLFMVEGTYPETAMEDEPASQEEPVTVPETIIDSDQNTDAESDPVIPTETDSTPAPVTDILFVEPEDDPDDDSQDNTDVETPVAQDQSQGTEPEENASPEDQPTDEPVITDETPG